VKHTGDMAQIRNSLPSKHKAMNSNSSTANKKDRDFKHKERKLLSKIKG
jgi:hypothetical protein